MQPNHNSLPPVKGQDVLRMTDENGGRQSDLKFDSESEADFELSDDESFKSNSNQERQVSSEKAAAVPDLDVDESVEKNVRKNGKRKKNRPILMWEVWEEEHERWLASHEDADIDIDNQNEVVAETAEAPPSLVMPLLQYQKEWLAWALQQEESAARGGILADEMGMGKTIQAIALVLTKQELNRAVDGALPQTSQSSGLPQLKATLVICPLVAVVQWVNEISRFTLKGSNKVLVYHGAKRAKTLDEFSDYDFVITTYSIVEAEYRKYVLPPKRKCNWCGKSFTEQKMDFHQSYFCSPDATYMRPKHRKNKNAGVDADDGKKKPLLKGKLYDKDKARGSGSTNDSGAEKGLCERNCNLHSLNWNRIILDEAHYIKDRRGNTTKAVLALNSTYKWALSGTPLQNRVGELYSLIRFLQISPYSYYFCKDCDCRTLDYSSNSDCSNCPHSSVRHFCWWNKHIATPIQSKGHSESGRDAMILLQHKILKSILLRRTKKGRSADLALPPKMMLLRRDSLDIKEEDYYTSLYNESRAQFNTYVTEGTVGNNYAHIFDLLTRLRQAVDHPYLVVYSKTPRRRNPSVIQDANNGELICGLCHESVEDPVVSACSHVFCASCLIGAELVLCPTCKEPLTADFGTKKDQGDEETKTSIKGFKRSSILNRIRLDDFQTSTKIEALREEIRFMVERDGSAKGIVFSQFTSFLDLIHYSLQKSGVQCVQLDGSMTMKARDAAITRFTEDPDCRLFLMSLKAGGVALNLTVASHVFLMDPWWNPAVEQQAQDRIHRIGQFKPIRVVRFVIEGTIEERILTLQEKKELVFEGTVGGSANALGKLTENDMKFLFVT
ncbi:ATP-dependent helicase rhp16-like [Apium graveolens]|uniref:ATP-dependent helicase rhp16-like n=1 Tax=Apium graveolens TaxID=4045 RepID=UPI003D78E414